MLFYLLNNNVYETVILGVMGGQLGRYELSQLGRWSDQRYIDILYRIPDTGPVDPRENAQADCKSSWVTGVPK